MFQFGPLFTVALALIGTYWWFKGPQRIEYKPRVSVLWYTILLHAVWGVLLFLSTDPQNITAINTVVRMGMVNPQSAGVLYLSVALLALMGLFVSGKTAIMYLLPQNVVLALSAFGALRAMYFEQFADGVLRSRAFLVTDQAPNVIIFLLHTVVICNLLQLKRVIR